MSGTFKVTASEVSVWMRSGHPLTLIELRHHHQHDWSLYKANGALRFEKDTLIQHLEEIPHTLPVIVFSDCPGMDATVQVAQELIAKGWSDVHALDGGFDAYLKAGLPVEPVSKAVSAARVMYL